MVRQFSNPYQGGFPEYWVFLHIQIARASLLRNPITKPNLFFDHVLQCYLARGGSHAEVELFSFQWRHVGPK